jgi:short-subunit dehydrogenase
VPPAGRVVLVTGASSGIGAALALELARRGFRLALTARRGDRLEAVAVEARMLGAPDVLTIVADLADEAAPATILDATIGHFGGLDVLINNAGLGLPEPFAMADRGLLRRQVEVNLLAPMILTHRAIPALAESRGTIINVGSAISTVAIPMFGAYGMTKAGLAYWNDALRRELRPQKIKVCLVEPGPISTEFFSAISSLHPEGNGETERTKGPAIPPPSFVTGKVADVARRISDLIDRPKRRLSVLRRFVWPMRVLGGFFRAAPGLADLALADAIRRLQREWKDRPPA